MKKNRNVSPDEMTEEELIWEMEEILTEIENDESLKGVEVPEGMYERVKKIIREKEAYRELSQENKRLIEYGKKYVKMKKQKRYSLLVAVLMSFLMCSIISVGGPERFFRLISVQLFDGVREARDTSADIIPSIDREGEAYSKIEKKYGFFPIRIGYLPKGSYFKEYYVMEELPAINMLYERDGEAKVVYWLAPNYRESSFANIIEDELLEEFSVEKTDDLIIEVKKYRVEENGVIRWIVKYEYQDVFYSMNIIDVEREEVEKILNDLYFP